MSHFFKDRRSLSAFLILFFSVSFLFPQEESPLYVVKGSGQISGDLNSSGLAYLITREDIVKSGKTSLEEVLRQIPCIQISSGTAGNGSLVISMRGAGGDNPFGQVQVIVDGVSENNPDMTSPDLSAYPLSIISRIEVYDGNCGSKAGNGAVGGVIKIYTRENPEKISGGILAQAGSFKAFTGAGDFSFGSETSSLGVFLNFNRTEGYRENSKSRSIVAGLKGFWDFNSWLTGNLSFNFGDWKRGLPGSISMEQFESTPSLGINKEDTGRERSYTGRLGLSFEGDSLDFDFPVTYSFKERGFDFISYSGFNNYSFHKISSSPVFKLYGKNNILDYTVSAGFDFTGVVYKGESYSDIERNLLLFDYDMNQFSYSPYVLGILNLGDYLVFDFGGRWDGTAVSAKKESSGINSRDFYSNTAFDLGISYLLGNYGKLYGKAGTMYRIPFIDEKAALTGWGDGFNSGLKSEKGYSFEAGGKISFTENFSLILNGFYTLMRDEIAYVYNPLTYSGTNENYEKTRRAGGNINLNYNIGDLITFTSGFNYTDGRFAAGENKGKFIPNLSPYKFTAGVSALLPFGFTLVSDFNLSGAKYASGDKSNEGGKLPVLPLWNCSLDWKTPFLEGLRFNVSLSNILNISYAEYALYSGGIHYVYPGEPFKFQAGISYSF